MIAHASIMLDTVATCRRNVRKAHEGEQVDQAYCGIC